MWTKESKYREGHSTQVICYKQLMSDKQVNGKVYITIHCRKKKKKSGLILDALCSGSCSIFGSIQPYEYSGRPRIGNCELEVLF